MHFRHGDHTAQVVFAAGGKVLASAGQLGFGVCLWDAATGRPLHRLTVPNLSLSLAVSPDGKTIVTDSLSLIDVATGKEVRRLEGAAGAGAWTCVAFSPDARTTAAAVAGKEWKVGVWNITTGKQIQHLGNGAAGSVVAFSPNGKILASGSRDNTIRLWEVATGKELRRLKGHEKALGCLAFAPGGVLASAGEDSRICLWDIETGKLLHRMKSDGGSSTLAFSPDGKLLASGGSSGLIRLWKPDTGEELHQWTANSLAISAVAFSPDGKVLASAGRGDAVIRRWNVSTRKEIDPVNDHIIGIASLVSMQGGKTLFSRDWYGKALKWDLTTAQEHGSLVSVPPGMAQSGAYYPADTADISDDGKLVTVVKQSTPGQQTEQVILWDTVKGKELQPSIRIPASMTDVCLSRDGKILVAGAKDSIRIWDVATGRQLHHLRGHVDGWRFAVSRKRLACFGTDRTLRLWDLRAGKEIRRWESRQGANAPLARLLFSPDSRLLASADYQSIRIWVADTGTEIAHFPFEPSGVLPWAFSPSGRILAAAGLRVWRQNGDVQQTATISLWEVFSGQQVRQIDVPQGQLLSLAFTGNGRTLASGGRDTTILLWDLANQRRDKKPGRITAAELERLWADLNGDGPKADRALWTFAATPKEGLPFLKEHLWPVAPADAKQVAKLITDLDSKSFAARSRAAGKLEEMSQSAEAALRKTLESNLSLEVRRRIVQVLEKRDKEMIRSLRALEALEHIGTREAQEMLEGIAKRIPNPGIAERARAALERLADHIQPQR
jgi:WD40 repeat protein